MALSRQNKDLVKEIEEIRRVTLTNYDNIHEYSQKTVRLKAIKEQLIRGRVIMWHSWVDESMDHAISNYFFYNHKRGGRGRIGWNSNKYSRFKYYLLERVAFRRKMELVLIIKPFWRKYKNIVEKLDSLRNILAHSFFPEDRPKKPLYKNKDIFTLEGVTLLETDMQGMHNVYKKLI